MWEHQRVNKKFLNSLRRKFGTKVFSNEDAYNVYYDHHCKNGGWMEMNVRNNLCAAVYKGGYGLKRIGPGKYQFEV